MLAPLSYMLELWRCEIAWLGVWETGDERFKDLAAGGQET